MITCLVIWHSEMDKIRSWLTNRLHFWVLVQKSCLGLRYELISAGDSQGKSGAYLLDSFKDTNLSATYSKCITIMPKGVMLAHCIGGEYGEVIYEKKHFILK